MDAAIWQANSTFNPYAQQFLILAPDGTTPLPADMSQLLMLQWLATSQGIIYGTQIGLTAMLFVVLLLMTKTDKRRSAVFLFNSLALLLLVIRNILACVELTTIFYNFYNWELNWYPETRGLVNAQRISVSTELLNFFIDAVIYASLVLQVHIVCCTIGRGLKLAIIGLSAAVALAAMGVRLCLAIINIKYEILGINSTTAAQVALLTRVASTNNIISIAFIALVSLIFVTKLAFAIYTRRKLNMTQFGPMQIIFVMGCQTLLVPLIFSVTTYYAGKGSQLNSMVQTIVAIFLPLSGMWASVHATNAKAAAANNRHHRAVPVGATDLSSGKAYGSKGTTDTADTLIGSYEHEVRMLKHAGGASMGTADAMDMDLEMQRVKNGVVVDRTYSVRSD